MLKYRLIKNWCIFVIKWSFYTFFLFLLIINNYKLKPIIRVYLLEYKMKSAGGGAADPPSSSSTPPSDNSAGRRRRQHRAPSPATAQEGPTKRPPRPPGSRSRSPLRAARSRTRESLRSADGREREPESRGGAAVHPDGAEADVVRPNRADAVGEDPTDSSASARRSALRLPCLNSDSSQRLLPGSRASLSAEKGKKPAAGGGGERRRSGASAGCGAGLGLGLWRGGCLQAELIQFHLHKRLRRSGAKMQSKTDDMGTEEAALGEPEPAAEATEAGSTVTQQDQAFEDEMERLIEENEDLKV